MNMNLIKYFVLSACFATANAWAQIPAGGQDSPSIGGHPLPKVATNPLDAINDMIGGYGTDVGYQALLWGTYNLAERATPAMQLSFANKQVKDLSQPSVTD